MFFCAGSLQANPISIPEKPMAPEITFLVGFAILLEAACILFLLRRSRKPRLFILWIVGMHLLTYPAFLGLLWLLQDMRPAFAAALGEGVVVLVEGSLIYLICHCAPSAKSNLPMPSGIKCFLASFVGNGCSLIAFPLLLASYNFIFQTR
jgi:hypothetical protein